MSTDHKLFVPTIVDRKLVGEWTTASEIKAGTFLMFGVADSVFLQDIIVLVSQADISSEEEVYCLSLAKNHNYFVSELGIIVHNFVPLFVGLSFAFGGGEIVLTGLTATAILGGLFLGASTMKDNSGDFSLKGHGGIVTESPRARSSSVAAAGGSPGGPRPPKKDDDEEEKKKKKGCCKEKDKEIDLIRREKVAESERANIAERGRVADSERANLAEAALAAANKLAADKLAEKGLLDGKMGTAAAVVAGGIVTNAINEVLPKPVSTVYNYFFPDKKKEENNVAPKPVAPAVVDTFSEPKPEHEVG